MQSTLAVIVASKGSNTSQLFFQVHNYKEKNWDSEGNIVTTEQF